MAGDEPEWRRCLISRLRERNRNESDDFTGIIQQNNRLLDNVAQLKSDNLKLSVENEQMRTAISTGVGGKEAAGAQLTITSLEKKLLAQQEELTDLHKRKGENSQLIVDLNVKVDKQNKLIADKEQNLAEIQSANNTLRAEVQLYRSSLEELKKLNTTLLDEHKALQLAFSKLEEKLRGVQNDNRALLEELMQYKSKDADKLNEENENFIRKRTDKVKRDLEEAARETNSQFPQRNSISPTDELLARGGSTPIELGAAGDGAEYFEIGSDAMGSAQMKTFSNAFISGTSNTLTMYMKFEAHETESHAVRWSPVERLVATGGTDRKVKLWDVGKGSSEPRAVLGSSSAGINSVDFDSTGSYIIGTSNDYGARIWTVADSRLKLTLTGHSGKVMAAKYLQEPIKIVTGSHDRTLKIWDLRSNACIETKFAGSSCNDLVTADSLGSTIISGHYDKKIRFWDIRTEKQTDDIFLAAKITSLDLSKDCNYLICSVRDDTIKLIDLRKNLVITTFSNENFKLSCDWARASFNTNATRIACGSADGLIYVWNICGRLESTLKGHTSGSGFFHSAAVNAVSWSPSGSALASVGKGKRCIIYMES